MNAYVKNDCKMFKYGIMLENMVLYVKVCDFADLLTVSI